MNTKLHAVIDAESCPIRFLMTAGEVSDFCGCRLRVQMGYSACAPFPTTAFVEVLRFELMVERGLCEAATSIREEAQHETLCRIGCFGEIDRNLHG